MDRQGALSDVARRGVGIRPPLRRRGRPVVRRAIGWAGLAGADGRCRASAADDRADRRPPTAAGFRPASRRPRSEQAIALGCVDAQMLCVDVGTDGRPGGRCPHRPLRARWTRHAPARRCCSGTRSTIRPRRCCWASAAGSGARSIAGMRPYDPPWCRPLLGRPARGHPPGMRRAGHRRRGTTRTTPIAASPAPGCAPRCCRCSRMCSAAGSPRRSPAPPTALREDTETLDELAQCALAAATVGRRSRHRTARRSCRRPSGAG